MLGTLKRVPELTFLIGLAVLGFAIMAIFSKVEGTDVLSPGGVWVLLAGSFVLSLFIAIVAVIGGVGGGVLFTPLMLGFTSVDTLIVRSLGLVVAMFSGLVSSGPFMKQGLADIKIVFYCAIPIIVGALSGAQAAIFLSSAMGESGDALVRMSLGIILVFIAGIFVLSGSNTEYPTAREPSAFSRWIGLRSAYWESSLGRAIDYQAERALIGGLLFLIVGFTGGFFGLGGGWAVVPVLNLIMSVPLKVSAASSGVLLAIGNGAAIWPYIIRGSLIASLAVPWMLGQVIGGILGAYILAKVKAGFVRIMLIILLLATSVRLISRGFETLTGINIPLL